MVHLVQEELQTGVMSTGVPTPMLELVIIDPVVTHLNAIGIVLKSTPLQSRYTTNLIKKLSCPTQRQVKSDPIKWLAFALFMVVNDNIANTIKPNFFMLLF